MFADNWRLDFLTLKTRGQEPNILLRALLQSRPGGHESTDGRDSLLAVADGTRVPEGDGAMLLPCELPADGLLRRAKPKL
jgi:hypothetical protein